jgi:orotate phosphoribosyltransferase
MLFFFCKKNNILIKYKLLGEKMDKNRIEEIFAKVGALLEGHFLLTSGVHSRKYMQCARIFQYPEYTEEIVSELVKEFKDDKIDVVVGPATGGIILAYEFARQLKVKNFFAENNDNKMIFRMGFNIKKGDRVLIVEDVIATGAAVFKVIDLIKEKGGIPVGVAVVIDRMMGKEDFGLKFKSAYTTFIDTYDFDNCPLCKENIPIFKPSGNK